MGRRQGAFSWSPWKVPLPEVGISWADYMGASLNEENAARFNYEDKLASMWNTYGTSTVAGFEESGCAGTRHDPAQGNNPGRLRADRASLHADGGEAGVQTLTRRDR